MSGILCSKFDWYYTYISGTCISAGRYSRAAEVYKSVTPCRTRTTGVALPRHWSGSD